MIPIDKISKINILIYALLVSALLQCTYQLTHSQQKQYNASKYADALQSQQKQFSKKADQIKTQIQKIQKVLNDTQTQNNTRLVQLNQGIADQRNSLYSMQQILKIPFELRSCQCPKLDQSVRNQINQKIDGLSQDISSLRSSLKKCNQQRCPRYQQIAFEISQSQNYLNIMKQTINAECCRPKYVLTPQKPMGFVNLQNTLYKDNLNAQNWYYGSMSQKQYSLKRFELTSKFNLTSCPIQTPFADQIQNKCFKCQQNEYFNLGNRQCTKCQGEGSFMNLTTGQCATCPPTKYFDSKSKSCLTCPKGQIFNNTQKICKNCKKNQAPNYQKAICQPCPDESFYNLTIQKCQACNLTAGQFLNFTTFICDQCPLGTHYSTNDKACVYCPDSYYYNYATGMCKKCPDQSYYIRKQNVCKACPNGTTYDPTLQQCLSCPSGYKYDVSTQKCVSTIPNCPADYPYYNSKTNLCDRCNQTSFFDQTTKSCKLRNFVSMCPPDRPLYNTTTFTCLPCPANKTYDSTRNVCSDIVCKPDQILNADTKKCVSISSTCKPNQYYNTTNKKCQDISTRCNLQIQTFSSTLNKCVLFSQACSKGEVFNKTTRTCINPATLCTKQQFYSYTTQRCLQISSTCSADQYYDKVDNKCEPRQNSCKIDQYYNKTLHQCRPGSQICTVDQVYNSIKKVCIQKSTLCTDAQFYSIQQHSCVQGSTLCHVDQYYYKPTNSCKTIAYLCSLNGTVYDVQTNGCTSSCPVGYQLAPNSNICQITDNNGQINIKKCQLDQTYLKQLNTCVKTFTRCKQNQFYNSTSYKCQGLYYITSPFATNLLMQSKPFSSYQFYYKQKKTEFSSNPLILRDCPVNLPYFDSVNNKCIECTGQFHLFNLQSSKCSKCGWDYTYNPTQRRCLLKTK